jgi:hypothetical protein
MRERDGIICDRNHPDYEEYGALLLRMDLAWRKGEGVEFDADEVRLMDDFGFGDVLAAAVAREIS